MVVMMTATTMAIIARNAAPRRSRAVMMPAISSTANSSGSTHASVQMMEMASWMVTT